MTQGSTLKAHFTVYFQNCSMLTKSKVENILWILRSHSNDTPQKQKTIKSYCLPLNYKPACNFCEKQTVGMNLRYILLSFTNGRCSRPLSLKKILCPYISYSFQRFTAYFDSSCHLTFEQQMGQLVFPLYHCCLVLAFLLTTAAL